MNRLKEQIGQIGQIKKTDVRNNIEGIEGIVPYKGEVIDVLREIEDGLKSGMSYVGARSINDLREIEYCVLTESGKKESGYHDITVI